MNSPRHPIRNAQLARYRGAESRIIPGGGARSTTVVGNDMVLRLCDAPNAGTQESLPTSRKGAQIEYDGLYLLAH